MRLHPRDILGNHGGVDDEEGFVFGNTVCDEVVDHAAVFIEHQGVLTLAGGELGKVIREDGVEPRDVVFSADEDLSHVGNIEGSYFFPDGGVLSEDGGVLDGHGPAAEGDEFRT